MSEVINTIISSNKVTVFPCVGRSISNDTNDINLSAKLMSEKNITNIIKSITDRKSYIISYNETDKLMKFILDGYYFEVFFSGDYALSGTLYAFLSYNNVGEYTQVIYGDEGDFFKGLIISTKPNEGGEYLVLCENGNIPDSSYNKFNPRSLADMSNIDCGVIGQS
jgi:hypothetical protein